MNITVVYVEDGCRISEEFTNKWEYECWCWEHSHVKIISVCGVL